MSDVGASYCRAEAIRGPGAVHESYFEHCLLLGIVVAEATQRLITTGWYQNPYDQNPHNYNPFSSESLRNQLKPPTDPTKIPTQ